MSALIITDSVASGDADGPVLFTFSFSEAVADFDLGTIVLSHGTASNFTKVNDTTYSVLVTPEANSTNAISISVAANSVHDLNGNALASTVSASQTVDTTGTPATDSTPPTLIITDSVASGDADGPVLFTFSFSEAVADFDLGTIVLSHGTVTGLTKVNDTTYSVLVTPEANSTNAISISVAANSVHDLNGNALASTVSASQTVDTTGTPATDSTPPTLIITDSVASGDADGPVLFTFSFSEVVADYVMGALVRALRIASNFTKVNDTTYSVLVTPEANSTNAISISVVANSVHDLNGNALASTVSASQTVDTTAPSAPSLSLAHDTGTDTSDGITSDGTMTVSGLESGAVWEYSTNGGTNWTTGSGSSFVLAEGVYATNQIQVRQSDRAGTVSAASTYAPALTIDTTAPSAPSLSLAHDTGTDTSDGITSDGTMTVSGLESGAVWEYSTNGGTNWTTGSGGSFVLAG